MLYYWCLQMGHARALICTCSCSSFFSFLFLFFCPSKSAQRGHPKFLSPFTLCYKSSHLIPKNLLHPRSAKEAMFIPNSRQHSPGCLTGSSTDSRIKFKPSTLWAPPLTVSSAFSDSNSSNAPATTKSVTPVASK